MNRGRAWRADTAQNISRIAGNKNGRSATLHFSEPSMQSPPVAFSRPMGVTGRNDVAMADFHDRHPVEITKTVEETIWIAQ